MGTRSFVHTFLHSRQTGAPNTRLQWISFVSAIAVALSCGVQRSDSSSSSVPAVGIYLAACGFVKKNCPRWRLYILRQFFGLESLTSAWLFQQSDQFRFSLRYICLQCVAVRLLNTARHFYRKSNMLTAVLCILIFTYSLFLAFSCFFA